MSGLIDFWWTHAAVLPVLLPVATAALLLVLGDQERLRWRRQLSLASCVLGLLLAIGLVWRAAAGEIIVYELGEWPAPFGIVLMVDRLSAMFVLLAQAVAVPVLWYATCGWDTRGRHFHAVFQFQLMGLAGAFLTGDLFNLFVFFEVLLIASYVLLMHGLGRERLRMGLHYVVLNLAASSLFLIGLAMVYGVSGTLNMVDLNLRLAELPPDTAALAASAGLLLLVVFGLKAAIVPLYFWLPGAYAAASAPVAALFALMTKVGVYSIVRVHGMVFGEGAGPVAQVAQDWILPAALVTSALGVFGALAARSLGRLVGYLTVSSVGTILIGVGLFTPGALSAALYYTLHSTIVIAGLFLLVELAAAQRGDIGDQLRPAVAVREPLLLGGLMLLGAASAAGLPPLPGFLGKVMLLQSASGMPGQSWVWAVLLLVGFFTLIGLARAGVVLFWHVEPGAADAVGASGSSRRMLSAAWAFVAMTLVLAVLAGPVKAYTDAAAAQLASLSPYQQAVLGGTADTRRPYDARRPEAPAAKREKP
jgi:multicomponent K+:H+ antiporter subunit D